MSPPENLHIRSATKEDLLRVASIYNYEVINSLATFDCDCKTGNDFAWHLADTSYPLYVASINKEIVGYSSLNKFSSRAAYSSMCEISIYIDKSNRRQGLGAQLLKHIMRESKLLRYSTSLACVTSSNNAMIDMLSDHGFLKSGELRNIGIKFNKSLSLALYQHFNAI